MLLSRIETVAMIPTSDSRMMTTHIRNSGYVGVNDWWIDLQTTIASIGNTMQPSMATSLLLSALTFRKLRNSRSAWHSALDAYRS